MMLGLVYHGAVSFTLPEDMPVSKRSEVNGKIMARAEVLADQYRCHMSFERIEYGTGFQEFGHWFLLRFEAFRDLEVSFATRDLERYAKKFKGVRFVDRAHLDYRGKPKLWVD